MEEAEAYVNTRLDRMGIVARACQEIGFMEWLDGQEPGNRKPGEHGKRHRSDTTSWLEWSLRQWYLVPQCSANIPVEHVLGPGRTPEMLTDDCLGHTLDRLHAHDLTKLFAGIATQTRQIHHAGLARSRGAVAFPPCPDPADHSRSRPQAHRPVHDAALVLEGIALLPLRTATTSRILVFHLQPLHWLIVQLFGPLSEQCSLLSGSHCGMVGDMGWCGEMRCH